MAPRVVLATLPWQSVESPSLPIGILRTVLESAGKPMPATWHGNLRWAEYLLESTDGAITPVDYMYVAEQGLFHGMGDWVFSGLLNEPSFGLSEFSRYLADSGVAPGRAADMRDLANGYVELAVRELDAHEPDVVGFTTTFMQNVPTLVVARELKRKRPDVKVVLGGGNCDGPMGGALHRAFPFIDYVVRGEGEEVFPALLDAIAANEEPQSLPGVCWRDGDRTVANPESTRRLPAGRIPAPDYDDWYQHFDVSPVQQYVDPKLVLEAARGCWWGEIHQCTFCGLNGSSIGFRSKAPEQVISEITESVRRYRTLDVIMVDNIMDNSYYASVLPALAQLDWDLRIHYEVKSNLKTAQAAMLRDAHIVHVQPGIESLSSKVLDLMEKGVDAIHNVRALRDCESAGLTVSWNWIYGFPGETPDDYADAVAQIPALVHLQPPVAVARITLERFSPYFDQPNRGFPLRRSSVIYKHVYDLPEDVLAEMVYLFDTDTSGLEEGTTTKKLRQACDDWKSSYTGSSLTRVISPAWVHIHDNRAGWPPTEHRITDPLQVMAYQELENGRSVTALAGRLRDAGFECSSQMLQGWLDELASAGLAWHEGDRWITLATSAPAVKVAE